MFSTVARISERDVSALLALLAASIQDARRARGGGHYGQDDADGQTGAAVRNNRVARLVVVFSVPP